MSPQKQIKIPRRKDGTLKAGPRPPVKGEERAMWSGRLPLSAIAKAKALSGEGKPYASQADAVAAALAALS